MKDIAKCVLGMATTTGAVEVSKIKGLIEVLQVGSLIIGIVVGILTAISIALSVRWKIKNNKEEKEKDNE